MAKVDLASGKIEKEANTDCRECVHFVSCESGKQIYVKSCGVNCRDFEEYCATCTHETDDSGYCTECYYGGKWQRKNADKPKITCLNCKYLELSLPYGVCSEGQKGMVEPDDCCGKGEPREKGEDNG